MKSFLEFITEMPRLSPVMSRTNDGVGEPLKTHLGGMYPYAKKVSTHEGHHVYQLDHPSLGSSFFLVHPKTKKIAAKVVGRNLVGTGKGSKLEIGYAQKHSEYPGKMKNFYKHLVIDQGLTINSDTSHSRGSYELYKSLSDDPDLEVTHKSFIGDKLTMHKGRSFGTNYFNHTSHFVVTARKKK